LNLQKATVNLPELPATALRVSRTETGLKLQLDLTLSQKMLAAAIEREIARVILVEMIYRNQPGIGAGEVYIDPPAWLVDGLLESASDRNRAALALSLATPIGLPEIGAFLNQRPETLDPIGRQLYRAYSFVLVQTLIDRSTGPVGLARYVGNLAFASNDVLADLRRSFPEMPDLDIAWKVKAGAIKASLDRDLLTFAQSDDKLNELLTGSLWNEGGKPVTIENISPAKLTPTQRADLQLFSGKLLRLATRANPVLRPVIQNYQQIADQLVLGKTRGIRQRLAELRSVRLRLSARMNEVDDYLNWFEAAKTETPSGIFEECLEPASGKSQKPKRQDPLSIYLDAMELEF
ncbi:MAG TPA: hypothetical protein VJ721_07270, partial [Chthoniobacterales bacterium]|nr:hypothetical protein [Chthoniobacterales bacterium]